MLIHTASSECHIRDQTILTFLKFQITDVYHFDVKYIAKNVYYIKKSSNMTYLCECLEYEMRLNQQSALSHSEIEFLGDHLSTLGGALQAVAEMKGVSDHDRSEYARSLLSMSENDMSRVRKIEDTIHHMVCILGIEKSNIS